MDFAQHIFLSYIVLSFNFFFLHHNKSYISPQATRHISATQAPRRLSGISKPQNS